MSAITEQRSSGPPVKRTEVYDSAQQYPPVIRELSNLWRHRDMVRLLVARDLKVRYKRSVLGLTWTMLNPLLALGVIAFVFNKVFGNGLDYGWEPWQSYPVYVLSGLLIWTFFAQGITACGTSLLGNAGLLGKVYIPGEVFSASAVGAGIINLLLALGPLLVIALLTGHGVHWTWIFLPIPIIQTAVVTMGVGLIIGSAAVFFSDILDLVQVLTSAWFFTLPIIWVLSAAVPLVPPLVAKLNPFYPSLASFRTPIFEKELPEAWQIITASGYALAALGIGAYVFSRSWRALMVRL